MQHIDQGLGIDLMAGAATATWGRGELSVIMDRVGNMAPDAGSSSARAMDKSIGVTVAGDAIKALVMLMVSAVSIVLMVACLGVTDLADAIIY